MHWCKKIAFSFSVVLRGLSREAESPWARPILLAINEQYSRDKYYMQGCNERKKKERELNKKIFASHTQSYTNNLTARAEVNVNAEKVPGLGPHTKGNPHSFQASGDIIHLRTPLTSARTISSNIEQYRAISSNIEQ